jgi:dTDP-4-dehydrorhamnose reductase
MHVVIFGGEGQVGRELARLAWPSGVTATALGRSQCDITDPAAIERALAALRPDILVNAAAYTAVDRAENEPDRAFAINRDGARHLAERAAGRGLPLIHISTDYVFDGSKIGPYLETDPVAPLGIYGSSKQAGEAAIIECLDRHVILRTAWVFGAFGGNFVKTMLRLSADRPELRVVADQIGGPTAAQDIAAAIGTLVGAIERGDGNWGVFHFAGTPPISWHGFATEIIARAAPLPNGRPIVTAITTAEFPTPARRPANSVLDCSKIGRAYGIPAPDWGLGLDRVLAALSFS